MVEKKIAIANENDEIIGAEERKLAIEKSLICRVVRLLLFNSQGQVFLQKRRFNMLYEGIYDGKITLQKEEISDGKFFDPEMVEGWMKQKPSDFTLGSITAFNKYKDVKNRN